MNDADIYSYISGCEMEMKETYDKLTQAISNCKQSQSTLINKDFIDYVLDVFYPCNKMWRKDFETSIQELIDLLEQSKTLANNNLMNLWCIKKLIPRSRKLFPVFIMYVNITLGIAKPDLLKKSKTPLVVLAVFIGFTIISMLSENIILIIIAAFFVTIIVMFICAEGINIRKDFLFEGINLYEQKKQELRWKVHEPLKEISRQFTLLLDYASEQCSANQYSLNALEYKQF